MLPSLVRLVLFAFLAIAFCDPDAHQVALPLSASSSSADDGTAPPPLPVLTAERIRELRGVSDAMDALPDQMEQMREALDAALDVNRSLGVPDRLEALEALQELVEDVDNARDLMAAGGFAEVKGLLAAEEARLQAGAAWVLGTAAQNDEALQSHLCSAEVDVMPGLAAAARRASVLPTAPARGVSWLL